MTKESRDFCWTSTSRTLDTLDPSYPYQFFVDTRKWPLRDTLLGRPTRADTWSMSSHLPLRFQVLHPAGKSASVAGEESLGSASGAEKETLRTDSVGEKDEAPGTKKQKKARTGPGNPPMTSPRQQSASRMTLPGPRMTYRDVKLRQLRPPEDVPGHQACHFRPPDDVPVPPDDVRGRQSTSSPTPG